MIEYEVFEDRLKNNKCLKSNLTLNNNEYIVSKKSFSQLYQYIFDEVEYKFIKNIVSCIHKNNRNITLFDSHTLEKVQLFFNILILIGDKYIKEREIHLYIFLFWDKLIWDKELIDNVKKNHFFYEGQIIDENDKFQQNLLPFIASNCDLIYYDNKNNSIKLIEIKNVDLDDRAISQIQRYYRNTNYICETSNHQLNILHLQPTLIIKHENLTQKKAKTSLIEYWQTFPTYFRELLNIYSFEYCKIKGTLKLINLKPKLKSLLKN